MHEVLIIKPVIPQNINHQFVGREILGSIEFIHQLMSHFDQPGFAAVIFYYPITDMTHRAYGKNNLKLRIEIEETVKRFIQYGQHFVDG